MECTDIKKQLAAYLDHELDKQLTHEIETHLKSCPDCLNESQQMIRAWGLLDLAPRIEPSADYMSKFWTKVASQESGYERFVKGLKVLIGHNRLIPIATTLSVMFIVGSTVLYHQINMQNNLNQLKPDDIAMLQNIDLAEHLGALKDLSVIQDLDTTQKQNAI